MFIYRGMKSKRVHKLEHKLSENIRATQHLVRREVVKDINFLRRLLNEVNLLKYKVIGSIQYIWCSILSKSIRVVVVKNHKK